MSDLFPFGSLYIYKRVGPLVRQLVCRSKVNPCGEIIRTHWACPIYNMNNKTMFMQIEKLFDFFITEKNNHKHFHKISNSEFLGAVTCEASFNLHEQNSMELIYPI